MLLSPSVTGLKNMLDCCSEFDNTYNVKFNPSNSKCISFSQKKNICSPELCMNDVKLDNVQLVNHLGHILTSPVLRRTRSWECGHRPTSQGVLSSEVAHA